MVRPGTAPNFEINWDCLLIAVGATASLGGLGSGFGATAAATFVESLIERLTAGLLLDAVDAADAGFSAGDGTVDDTLAAPMAALTAGASAFLAAVVWGLVDWALVPLGLLVMNISWLHHHDLRGGAPVTLYVRHVSSHFATNRSALLRLGWRALHMRAQCARRANFNTHRTAPPD